MFTRTLPRINIITNCYCLSYDRTVVNIFDEFDGAAHGCGDFTTQFPLAAKRTYLFGQDGRPGLLVQQGLAS